jgi:IclR family acetate operon transcriptional repressor
MPKETSLSGEDAHRLVGSDRVLGILAELARHPDGITLEEMTRATASPKPTVHRALASLCRIGFASNSNRGRYLLGDEFLRLAFAHHESRPDHVRIGPVLDEIARRYGETAHYAVLDGDEVVYRSKADPPYGAVKLTSTVGGRNPAHCTGVGKVLLAHALPDDDAVAAWVGDRTLERRTDTTLTTVAALAADLRAVREQGYSTDDHENEPGIVCVAVPAYLTSPTRPSGAVSVSAPAYRTPLARLVEDAATLRALVARR